MKKNPDTPSSPAGTSWDDLKTKIFVPEDITESDLVSLIVGEIIKTRHEKELTQKQLGEMSDIEQTVIARIERRAVEPRLSTLSKLLDSLDLTIKVVPKD